MLVNLNPEEEATVSLRLGGTSGEPLAVVVNGSLVECELVDRISYL